LRTEPYKDQPDRVVMLPDRSEEFAYGWTVVFDLKEHIETGDFTKKPFSQVIVVPHDGTPAHWGPTHLPAKEYMRLRCRRMTQRAVVLTQQQH